MEIRETSPEVVGQREGLTLDHRSRGELQRSIEPTARSQMSRFTEGLDTAALKTPRRCSTN